MCIIIHTPKGVALPADLIRSAYARNDDGAGAIVIGPNGVKAEKFIPDNIDQAITWALRLPVQSERILHFRYATHGSRNALRHAHPFRLKKSGGWLIHNGVISELGSAITSDGKGESDTEELARHLGKLSWAELKGVWPLVAKTVLLRQRVVCVSPEGEQLWKGKSMGRKVTLPTGEIWLSNEYACSYGLPEPKLPKGVHDGMFEDNGLTELSEFGPGWLSNGPKLNRRERRMRLHGGRIVLDTDVSPEAKDAINAMMPSWSDLKE